MPIISFAIEPRYVLELDSGGEIMTKNVTVKSIKGSPLNFAVIAKYDSTYTENDKRYKWFLVSEHVSSSSDHPEFFIGAELLLITSNNKTIRLVNVENDYYDDKGYKNNDRIQGFDFDCRSFCEGGFYYRRALFQLDHKTFDEIVENGVIQLKRETYSTFRYTQYLIYDFKKNDTFSYGGKRMKGNAFALLISEAQSIMDKLVQQLNPW